MNTSNRTAYKRSNAAYNWMTVPTGTRQYLGEAAGALPLIASLIYAVSAASMFITERAAMAANLISVFTIIAAIALPVGFLLTWLGSLIKGLPDAVSICGLILLLLTMPLLFIVEFSETLFTGTWLEFLQSFTLMAEYVSLAILLFCMILMFFHVRTSPKLGMLPAYCGVIAALLLAIRTLSTYASLSSAIGGSYNWDNAQELESQIVWLLRKVDRFSDHSAKMFSARIFERITANILLVSALPQLLRYRNFFSEYFRQMDLTMEIPGVRQMIESRRRKGKRTVDDEEEYRYHARGLGRGDDFDDDFDDIDQPLIGVGSHRSGRATQQNDTRKRQPTSEELTLGCTESGETEPVIKSRLTPLTTYKQRMQAMLDGNQDAEQQPSKPKQPEIRRNEKTGAAIVKVKKAEAPKPTLPDPNDESIWYQYKD